LGVVTSFDYCYAVGGMEKIGYIQKYFGKKVYWGNDMRVSKIYFSDDELRCKGKDCGCGNVVKLNTIFDNKLYLLRKNVNVPMYVTSCCRCTVHNKRVGGVKRSYHLLDNPETNGTCAIDIKRGKDDLKLLLEAWDADFSIGVTPTFFHLDVRTEAAGKPQIMFAYAGKTDMKELERFKKLVGAK
jgi:hypothetical protein